MQWNEYVQIFVGLLVIIDPIGAIPLFVSLTGGQSTAERTRTARDAAIAVSIILIVSCLAGDAILRIFGISIASFRVGGGILLLLMAIAMMTARQASTKRTRKEEEEDVGREHVAVVPLAMPLMAGPGAISLAIIYANKVSGVLDTGLLMLACVTAAAAAWAALRLSIRLARVLGQTGINIVTRIMGIILSALAVEFIVSGVRELIR